ncbi:MAG: hypothetical protein SWH54_01275 [Thermodesulfobacteriota bacterium]|nr:hypothetical protein [Thermodesulfobacteriota bacterium]
MTNKEIDPFDKMENGHDRVFFIIRQIIAGVVVIGGIIFMVWFWLLSAKT